MTDPGGLTGSIIFSLLSQRIDVRILAIAAMFASTLSVTWFGRSAPALGQLSMLAAIAGFFTNGTVVCLYAILAERFPASMRAGGTGFTIGLGRGGAALSPILGGQLLAHGFVVASTALILSFGSSCAALALLLLGREGKPATPSPSPSAIPAGDPAGC